MGQQNDAGQPHGCCVRNVTGPEPGIGSSMLSPSLGSIDTLQATSLSDAVIVDSNPEDSKLMKEDVRSIATSNFSFSAAKRSCLNSSFKTFLAVMGNGLAIQSNNIMKLAILMQATQFHPKRSLIPSVLVMDAGKSGATLQHLQTSPHNNSVDYFPGLWVMHVKH